MSAPAPDMGALSVVTSTHQPSSQHHAQDALARMTQRASSSNVRLLDGGGSKMIWGLPAMSCTELACGGGRGVHAGELAPDGGLGASFGLGFSCSLHLFHPGNLKVRSDMELLQCCPPA